MFSYFYKLSSTPITTDSPIEVERNFKCLEAALERAHWHAVLPGMQYRFCYILDEHRALVVMDGSRFRNWQIRQAARIGEAL